MKKQAFLPLLGVGLALSIGVSLANTGISSQDLTMSSQQLSSAMSGRDMNLDDVTVQGRLTAGRNLTCQRCTVTGNIAVGHDLQLEQCEQVNAISSGHNASISDTNVLAHMTVGHDLTLEHATLESGAHVGNQVVATNSVIKGSLSLQGNSLKLTHSTTDAITFAKPMGGVIVSSGSINGSVIVQNSVIRGSRVTQQNGYANIQVGPNSLTNLNGYTVKGAPSQTTLITPEQTIYVNGAKVSGEGPKTYAQYREAHSDAPSIQGPGWTDSPTGVADKKHAQKTDAPKSQIAVNTIELFEQSRINGDVVFESGYGKVILHPGSEISGKVVNGRIERISENQLVTDPSPAVIPTKPACETQR